MNGMWIWKDKMQVNAFKQNFRTHFIFQIKFYIQKKKVPSPLKCSYLVPNDQKFGVT